MVVNIAVLVILIIISLISGIILKRIPDVSSIPDLKIPDLLEEDPAYKKLIKFLSSQQKIITIAIVTKAIRRLKIISLKTDNLSTRLLERIRKESDKREDD